MDPVGTTEGAIAACKVGDYVNHIDGSITGGCSATIVIEAKNKKKTVGALREELARARKNRAAIVAFGILANSNMEPLIEIFGQHDVIVNIPDFGQPDADYVIAEKLIVNGLKLARMLAVAALESPAPESIDLKGFKAICEQLAATSKARVKLKGDATRARGAIETIADTVDALDALLFNISEQFERAIAIELVRISQPNKKDHTPRSTSLDRITQLPLQPRFG